MKYANKVLTMVGLYACVYMFWVGLFEMNLCTAHMIGAFASFLYAPFVFNSYGNDEDEE